MLSHLLSVPCSFVRLASASPPRQLGSPSLGLPLLSLSPLQPCSLVPSPVLLSALHLTCPGCIEASPAASSLSAGIVARGVPGAFPASSGGWYRNLPRFTKACKFYAAKWISLHQYNLSLWYPSIQYLWDSLTLLAVSCARESPEKFFHLFLPPVSAPPSRLLITPLRSRKPSTCPDFTTANLLPL